MIEPQRDLQETLDKKASFSLESHPRSPIALTPVKSRPPTPKSAPLPQTVTSSYYDEEVSILDDMASFYYEEESEVESSPEPEEAHTPPQSHIYLYHASESDQSFLTIAT